MTGGSYPVVPLGDLCKVQSGFAFKSADWQASGVPVVQIGNVRPRTIELDGCKFVAEEVAAKAVRFRLHRDDILISMTGHIGVVGKVRDDAHIMLNQRVGRFEGINEGLVEPSYLFQVLQSADVREKLVKLGYGAAQPNISPKLIGSVQIPLPPLETQRRIAAILGAYDDLIEVNRRRVAVLEEMARGLFEEWFVRFRFPGHEQVPLLDTPNGPLPQEWEVLPVSRAFELLRGRSYRSTDLADAGGKPFVNLKCIERGGGFRIDGIKRYTGDFKPKQIVRRGDIVMAVTDMTQQRLIVGRVGRVPWLNESEAVISMDLVKVDPAPQTDREFIYCWLRFSDFGPTAAQHANGANVLHLSPKAVTDLPIALPDLATQTAFGERVRPIFAMAETLVVAERHLAASRDLLLPRLISGQLSLEAAEKELENAA